MRGWQLLDIEKLAARGMRIKIKKIRDLHVSDINDFKSKSKIPSLNSLRDKAQKEFNTFIRTRDKDKGCISCQTGGVEQAGHFFNAGQYTTLRFNEDNVHGQCMQDNYFKSGSLSHFRNGLINRIGEQRVLLLESAARNRVKKWTRGELEIIYKMYKEKNASLK